MRDNLISWREAILEEMQSNGDTSSDIVAIAIEPREGRTAEEELDHKFYLGYGGTDGAPFTIWTKNYIYFPVCYDGAEWVCSLSRNPISTPSSHFGGG